MHQLAARRPRSYHWQSKLLGRGVLAQYLISANGYLYMKCRKYTVNRPKSYTAVRLDLRNKGSKRPEIQITESSQERVRCKAT